MNNIENDEYTEDRHNLGWLVDKYLDIPEEFIDKGLRHVSCYPSIVDNYEVISLSIAENKESESNFCYINAHEPRFAITGFTDTKLSDYQKNLIYEYTSTYWNEILNGFKDAYHMIDNKNELEDEKREFDISKFPTISPDYRLLKNI